MNDLEKEIVIEEVLTRINEMTEADKKQRNIENRKIMMDVSKYFSAKLKEFNSNHPYDGKGEKVSGPHIWNAYREIRKLIPWIVGVRYSNMDNWNEFYRLNPGAETRETKDTVANQMIEEDKELATKIGCEMIDILFKYLEPNGWNEKKAASKRPEKPKRSPLSKRARI